MKSSLFTLAKLTLLYTITSLADMSAPPPGEYLAEKGRGTLLVTARKHDQYFKINAYGANGHSCFAEGISKNNVYFQENEGQEKTCQITFVSKPDLIQVTTSTEGCEGLCGARASIDQDYFKPDPLCLNKNKNLKLFKSYYTKKRFDLAEKTLRTVYDNCKKYMSIFEELEIVNDLAVTYKNLKKKDDCLSLIKPFDEHADMSATEIKEGYPPGDADNMLPLAKKLKFNRELCRDLK